jgi:divalent metal cation (Fe/Co/Zn/Cd) transporter
MPQFPPGARQIERRSLQIGVVASLLMAAMGISVYALSGSEALLLDGLYSGVMAASSFIAARIGANVVRPPDRAYPYG